MKGGLTQYYHLIWVRKASLCEGQSPSKAMRASVGKVTDMLY